MIKIDKENWKIETDCKTVGEFMTDASQFWLSVKVTIDDRDEYFFKGGQKTKVVDNTPIEKVLFDRTDYLFNSRASFRVFTAPKPKTVKKSGWIQLYKDSRGYFAGYVRESKEDFAKEIGYNCEKVAAVKIEWEEVAE